MLTDLIDKCSNFPAESFLSIEFIVCLIAILAIMRFAGKSGLFSYMTLAIIIGNIQVLKTADFIFLNYPAALGTIIFSSTFIVTDILSEFYGVNEARKAVRLSFITTLFFTIIMFITISIEPVNSTLEKHLAIKKIFLPLPSLFIASIISYLISQHLDIWIFQSIRKMTKGKYLALRTIISSAISSLFDNIIFSTLAFYIFMPNAVSFDELVYTYILGTYIFRVIIIILQAPIIYLVRNLFFNKNTYNY